MRAVHFERVFVGAVCGLRAQRLDLCHLLALYAAYTQQSRQKQFLKYSETSKENLLGKYKPYDTSKVGV